MSLITFVFSIVMASYSVNLIQEDQKILCENENGVEVVIHERDSYFTFSGEGTFTSIEFLDSGVLAKKNNNVFGHISLTQPGKAKVLIGSLIEMYEYQCKDVAYEKHCQSSHLNAAGVKNLVWSPTEFKVYMNSTSLLRLPVKRYGTYPNDGTYFLSSNNNGRGLHLIDYGQKIHVVYGKSYSLDCSYLDH